MTDDLTADDYPEAIADAHEAGDSARAHELIAQQSGEQPADEVESSDDSHSFDDPFVEYVPVPVEITDAVYSQFRDEFKDAHGAAALQNAWGDSAVAKDAIVGQLLDNAPEIGALYESFQTEAGGLSLEGVSAATQYLMDNSSFNSPEALAAAHPELDHLYLDHSDASGNLSPAGVKIILAYIAGKSGFEHTR